MDGVTRGGPSSPSSDATDWTHSISMNGNAVNINDGAFLICE